MQVHATSSAAGLPTVEGLSWEHVRDRARLAALEEPWDALCGPTLETVGPAWVRAWFDTQGRQATPCVLTARNRAGDLCAVLPLARRRWRPLDWPAPSTAAHMATSCAARGGIALWLPACGS